MYTINIIKNKVDKKLREFMKERQDIAKKLDRLRLDPRKECDAHPLEGRFKGQWSCWLGSNIRMIYLIDDKRKLIIVLAVGSHKIY
ncbi:MAG: type II toxin-antitoxin system mRNA interferase toxin, RelE/StbE family [Nanoarchaeota archaeon]